MPIPRILDLLLLIVNAVILLKLRNFLTDRNIGLDQSLHSGVGTFLEVVRLSVRWLFKTTAKTGAKFN